MRKSQRYEIASPWYEVERETVKSADWLTTDIEGQSVLVIRENASIKDTVDGRVYDQGAYRVRSFQDGRAFKRAKTFYGETAWSDSQRMFDDIVSEVRFAR